MFFDLEELYVQAVVVEVPYTMVQIMDEGLNKIKTTGVFTAIVTTWAAHNPNDKKMAKHEQGPFHRSLRRSSQE